MVLVFDDEAREPSQEEVADYAEFLGIDPEKEPHLMWIAKEGVAAPIPNPWKACQEEGSNEVFYFNFETSESVWDHPCDDKYRKIAEEEREKHKEKQASEDGKSSPAGGAAAGVKESGEEESMGGSAELGSSKGSALGSSKGSASMSKSSAKSGGNRNGMTLPSIIASKSDSSSSAASSPRGMKGNMETAPAEEATLETTEMKPAANSLLAALDTSYSEGESLSIAQSPPGKTSLESDKLLIDKRTGETRHRSSFEEPDESMSSNIAAGGGPQVTRPEVSDDESMASSNPASPSLNKAASLNKSAGDDADAPCAIPNSDKKGVSAAAGDKSFASSKAAANKPRPITTSEDGAKEQSVEERPCLQVDNLGNSPPPPACYSSVTETVASPSAKKSQPLEFQLETLSNLFGQIRDIRKQQQECLRLFLGNETAESARFSPPAR